jgi:plastocyanin
MKALLTIVILGLIGWGIYAMVRKDEAAPVPVVNQEESTELATREFTVTGKPFSFTPATLEVNRGERVRITFVNEVGTHDLVVEGYNVRTQVLQAGQSETIEFVAETDGTFEYYCSVGNHRQMGMKGTLIIN